VRQDNDVLWLDPGLVVSTSRRCADLIEAYERSGDPLAAHELSELYDDRFGLDFMYEDWSHDYRELLHVAYLHVIETQIREDMNASRFGSGIGLARRALAVDPRNEDIEVSLVRLLRKAGAHAAAAEQYERYASHMKTELGVEARPIDAL
jgi:two-component SAPR family response regulator